MQGTFSKGETFLQKGKELLVFIQHFCGKKIGLVLGLQAHIQEKMILYDAVLCHFSVEGVVTQFVCQYLPRFSALQVPIEKDKSLIQNYLVHSLECLKLRTEAQMDPLCLRQVEGISGTVLFTEPVAKGGDAKDLAHAFSRSAAEEEPRFSFLAAQ